MYIDVIAARIWQDPALRSVVRGKYGVAKGLAGTTQGKRREDGGKTCEKAGIGNYAEDEAQFPFSFSNFTRFNTKTN